VCSRTSAGPRPAVAPALPSARLAMRSRSRLTSNIEGIIRPSALPPLPRVANATTICLT
jgi:hypothetical protein